MFWNGLLEAGESGRNSKRKSKPQRPDPPGFPPGTYLDGGNRGRDVREEVGRELCRFAVYLMCASVERGGGGGSHRLMPLPISLCVSPAPASAFLSPSDSAVSPANTLLRPVLEEREHFLDVSVNEFKPSVSASRLEEQLERLFASPALPPALLSPRSLSTHLLRPSAVENLPVSTLQNLPRWSQFRPLLFPALGFTAKRRFLAPFLRSVQTLCCLLRSTRNHLGARPGGSVSSRSAAFRRGPK